MFHHKILHINYTTYNLRHDQDSLNPRTNADVMLLAHKDDNSNSHFYWYAHIIGIFHALIIHTDFFWIWWFDQNPGTERHPYTAGWKAKRLKQLGFISSDDSRALGFLDAQQVIHKVHLIPALAYEVQALAEAKRAQAAQEEAKHTQHKAKAKKEHLEAEKKKKQKMNRIDEASSIGDFLNPHPAQYAIQKLTNFEYVGLWYFSPIVARMLLDPHAP
ncbi:uncharacterized protein EDB93DRAFT_1253423 [Suillus bovinus]|uniref:uncharacterized protein n=1 Tax=Suillus bovinus TaxID=48563 RepID=UPI001B88478E|nr:uncharacterized protein EDB93DRAFT_1253423 [Suillus bovinus]KAG2138037.1 hypothetical protein EDB93DRAFT_1253423 [Suillus bovinus]